MAETIRVRATVNFGGLHIGEIVWVDPADPWMADRIRTTLLVPLEDPQPGPEADTADEQAEDDQESDGS